MCRKWPNSPKRLRNGSYHDPPTRSDLIRVAPTKVHLTSGDVVTRGVSRRAVGHGGARSMACAYLLLIRRSSVRARRGPLRVCAGQKACEPFGSCLLYTSDA